MTTRLRGVIAAAATPLNADFSIDIERLIQLTRFAAVDRPGTMLDLAQLDAELSGLSARIDRFAGPNLDLSSTEIRGRIAAGRPIRYLVPDSVAEYIAHHRLYRDAASSAVQPE